MMDSQVGIPKPVIIGPEKLELSAGLVAVKLICFGFCREKWKEFYEGSGRRIEAAGSDPSSYGLESGRI